VHNFVEQLLFARSIKNNIAKDASVDFAVRQQNGLAKMLDDFPVSRLPLFNRFAGNAVGINN